MISLFISTNTDFDGNGDVVLLPKSGTVKQVAGGSYDLTMVHPIDKNGKWKYLQPGAVVRVPVPREIIPNTFSGVDADVYKTLEETVLREGPSEPQAITYGSWSITAYYSVGARVTFAGKNYECTYYDETDNLHAHLAPSGCSWWKVIPSMTAGSAGLVSLKAGSELYYIEPAEVSGWLKMSTPYGITGYVKTSQVEFFEHRSASENKPRVITTQLFRIEEPTFNDEDNTVTVNGKHVSYDLNGNLVRDLDLRQASPAMAIGNVVGGLMLDYPGIIATNLTDSTETYTGEIKGKNGIWAILDPDKGIVSRFDAKFTRDNWDLFIMKKTNTDRGFRLEYGWNTRGVTWKRSSSDIITRVVPVAKDEEGNDLYLPEEYVDSPLINNYPVIKMERLKVDGQVGKAKSKDEDTTWTETDLLEEMRKKAGERFSVDKADVIVEEVTVQFEPMSNTEEYKGLKTLETVLLYDRVHCRNEKIDLEITLDVSEIEYEIVKKKITGIKLTNIRDWEVRQKSVTGYNVKNNSIGPEKLTDEVLNTPVSAATDRMPEYAGENHYNSKDHDGILPKGEGHLIQCWRTDEQGNPAWRNSQIQYIPTDSDLPQQGEMYVLYVALNTKNVYYYYMDSWFMLPFGGSYSLPLAADGTRGGVQIGYTQSGKNYPVQLDSEKMYVNVPWTADGGNAATVNGKTVDKNVPSDAVFTDTWKANSDTSEGYVASGSGQANKVWKTNADGVPAWRNDADTRYSDFIKSGSTAKNGLVPAPSTTAGTTKYLREDATWAVPPGTYSLPLAASGTRGGVQIGFSTSAANRNYAVQLSSEKMYVNVPWTDHYAWADITSKPATATRWPAWSEVTGKPNHAGSDSDGGPAQTVKGAYTGNGGKQNPNYFGTNKVGFLMMNTTVNSNSNYKDWLIMDCYSGNDVGGGVAFGVNRQNLGAYIMRSAAARTSWAESAELLGTHHLGYTTSGKNYPVAMSSGKLYVNVPWTDNNNAVTQTNTTSKGVYRVLLSGTADDTTRTEGARKHGGFLYNPGTGFAIVAKVAGDTTNGLGLYGVDGPVQMFAKTGSTTQVYTCAVNLSTGATSNVAWGTIQASSFSVQSSRLVKENVAEITEQEARAILAIRAVSFDFKEGFGQKNQFGVIAEEVEQIFPYAVTTPDDYREEDFDESKGVQQPLKSVDYSKFVPHLIRMVQVQQEKIDRLERMVEELIKGR